MFHAWTCMCPLTTGQLQVYLEKSFQPGRECLFISTMLGNIILHCIKMENTKVLQPRHFLWCGRRWLWRQNGCCVQVHLLIKVGGDQYSTQWYIFPQSHTLPYLQRQSLLWNPILRDSAKLSGQCGHVVVLSVNSQFWVPAAFHRFWGFWTQALLLVEQLHCPLSHLSNPTSFYRWTI